MTGVVSLCVVSVLCFEYCFYTHVTHVYFVSCADLWWGAGCQVVSVVYLVFQYICGLHVFFSVHI